MIYLETDRLILRDYSADDIDAYYRLKTDEQTMYYMQDIKCTSIEQAKDEFTEVLEDTFEIEEVSEYSTNAYMVAQGYSEDECIISAVVDTPSGYIKIRYQSFEDSKEAVETFCDYYDRFIEEGSEVDSVSGYRTDNRGGYIVLDDGDFLLSYYCSDNMVLKVEAHSEDCVDSAKAFVDELGLPVE